MHHFCCYNATKAKIFVPLLQIATLLLQNKARCYKLFCADIQQFATLRQNATNVTPTFLFLKTIFAKPQTRIGPHSARKRETASQQPPDLVKTCRYELIRMAYCHHLV